MELGGGRCADTGGLELGAELLHTDARVSKFGSGTSLAGRPQHLDGSTKLLRCELGREPTVHKAIGQERQFVGHER